MAEMTSSERGHTLNDRMAKIIEDLERFLFELEEASHECIELNIPAGAYDPLYQERIGDVPVYAIDKNGNEASVDGLIFNGTIVRGWRLVEPRS